MSSKETIMIELHAINSYKEGKTILECPYPEGSAQRNLWIETFNVYKKTHKENANTLQMAE